MPTDLSRGAYSGKETYLYYNSGLYDTPTWEEIPRARNIQTNDGPALADVEFHGAKSTGQIPGYSQFNGSFEYVLSRTTDTVWDFLKTSRDAADIVDLVHLDGPINSSASTGWRAPVILGEFAATANGGDPVMTTIPFGKADAYDASGNAIEKEPFTGTDPP